MSTLFLSGYFLRFQRVSNFLFLLGFFTACSAHSIVRLVTISMLVYNISVHYAISTSASVIMTTLAPHESIGLSLPPYITSLGPFIFTEWPYVFFLPSFTVSTGSFVPCFLFARILCWFTWIYFFVIIAPVALIEFILAHLRRSYPYTLWFVSLLVSNLDRLTSQHSIYQGIP